MSPLPANRSVDSDAPRSWSVSRGLSVAIVLVVGVLLVEVFFETWAQVLTGPVSIDPRVNLDNAAQWPKHLKNGLYLGLAALTTAKVILDRRWRDFRTAADAALLVLGAIMVLAGLVNDSSVGLVGQALFVYFRGVLVFYALRAADLTWISIRRTLLVVGPVVALNVVIALVQMFVGKPAYTALGWVDLTWAEQSRAQGLLPHPNHLGHVLGLTLLGFMAWMAIRGRVGFAWWAAATVVAVALSATQSRESLLGVLVAGVLTVALVRGSGRKVLGVCLILILCTVAQIVARPDNRAEWERRIGNVISALYHPVSSEPTATLTPRATAAAKGGASAPATRRSPSKDTHATPAAAPTPHATPSAAPVREIRVLYFQQAARIFQRQPLLGFGVGQFGGVVAEKNNPNWHKNPKFGPGGFNRYGFQAVQVDSFWLHLTMEAGLLGLLAYLVWLFLVIKPLLSRAFGVGREAIRLPLQPVVVWGVTAMIFAGVVAFLSPAFEDPLLPALLWTIVGIAWWAQRRAKEAQASVYSAETEFLPVIRDSSDNRADDTTILSTDEILSMARRPRRPN